MRRRRWIKVAWYFMLLILLERSLISFSNSEQLGARLCDLHVSSALVHPEPASFDGQLDPGAVLRRQPALLVQERLVNLLDVDAAVLDQLDAGGEFDQLSADVLNQFRGC